MLVGLRQIDNLWIMAAFFFLVGVFLFGPDSMISATAAIDFGTKRGAGTATGFVNGIGSIGGILGGCLPGKITTETRLDAVVWRMLVGLSISAVVLVPLWRIKPPSVAAIRVTWSDDLRSFEVCDLSHVNVMTHISFDQLRHEVVHLRRA